MNQNQMMNDRKPEKDQQEQHEMIFSSCSRRNPRLVYSDPDQFFGREFLNELIMEQQEQM